MPDHTYDVLKIVTLTDQERRVIARSLNITAALMDALDDSGVKTVLELAERIAPEEDEV